MASSMSMGRGSRALLIAWKAWARSKLGMPGSIFGRDSIWVTGTVLVIVLMWRNKVNSISMEHHLKMMEAEGY